MKNRLRDIFHQIQIVVERLRGIDFTAEIDSRTINHVHYAASSPLVNNILEGYFRKMNVGYEDSIIDVGCGKGRMLSFFSEFPFGNVGGVEYDKDLYDICKKNLSKLKIYRMKIYCDDAANFEGYDEYNYFYLFNPFHKNVMEGFIDKLKQSKRRLDRVIRVLYFNPLDIDMFINNGFCIDEELPHKIVILKL